eukprot:TRINITY_DN11962_c0_g1_i2.p1 TRINITY_DN11962_c0_g1~~TRINITY_DN11962_c0_g1_i2.p1  ORF type:complete len:182 (+),score=31.67 TRINITY_DN11962_c0_g1_i2:81-626(+)
MQRGLVGSEMCIRDRYQRRVHGSHKNMETPTKLQQTKRKKIRRKTDGMREHQPALAQAATERQYSLFSPFNTGSGYSEPVDFCAMQQTGVGTPTQGKIGKKKSKLEYSYSDLKKRVGTKQDFAVKYKTEVYYGLPIDMQILGGIGSMQVRRSVRVRTWRSGTTFENSCHFSIQDQEMQNFF